MCQRSSGAITTAWVGFSEQAIDWCGLGGSPVRYRSSEYSERGFCSRCGSSICAFDDGSGNVTMTIPSLDDVSSIIPAEGQHSYQSSAPDWWCVKIICD
jgi:hypothetical protein